MKCHQTEESRSRHEFWILVGILLFTGCSSNNHEIASAENEEKVLNVYNWADYVAPTTIADFEARTGIKVNYDTYDSNEVLETKLLTGHTGYDVVFPSAVYFERQVKAGVFLKLDKSKLPNLVNLDPEIMRRLALYDPGNDHGINYMWGKIGIGYNPQMVKKVLGTDTIDSWGALFDPGQASKLAKCGLALLDSPGDVDAGAKIYLGIDLNSESAEDLARIESLLTAVRPYIRYFNSSQHINDLSSGEICAAFVWNGDVLQARARAAAASPPMQVAYALPKEGSGTWFDAVAIPADAPHPQNAHAFLNYLMEPEVIAAASNAIGFANGNAASRAFVSAVLLGDPAVYPADEMMRKLLTSTVRSQAHSRDLNRVWTRIKTGQ
jgi:putrescine transport system substrate-binding protein